MRSRRESTTSVFRSSPVCPKVSVAMITYNHEAHIAQAIESVLMQEVGFELELIIGEDCSTDRTREIVLSYASRFRDKITVVTSEQNVGGQHNFIRTLSACSGEYTALLEGDDYWTAADKLRAQVAYLDANPDCAICIHDVDIVYEDDSGRPAERFLGDGFQEVSGIEDLLVRNFVPTCSAVFRTAYMPSPLPGWMRDLKLGDLPLHILVAEHGWVGYIDRVMGVYRKHGGGVWSSSTLVNQLEGWMEALEVLDKHLGGHYSRQIACTLFGAHTEASSSLMVLGEVDRAHAHLRSGLGSALRCRPVPLRRMTVALAEVYAQPLARAYRHVRYGKS